MFELIKTERINNNFSNLWLHTLCIFLNYGYISTIILICGILPVGSVALPISDLMCDNRHFTVIVQCCQILVPGICPYKVMTWLFLFVSEP